MDRSGHGALRFFQFISDKPRFLHVGYLVDDDTPAAHTFMPDTCLTPVVSNTAKRQRMKLKLCGGAWSRLWCALGWLLPSKAFESRKCVVLAFRLRRTTHLLTTHLRNIRWEKLGRALSVLSRNAVRPVLFFLNRFSVLGIHVRDHHQLPRLPQPSHLPLLFVQDRTQGYTRAPFFRKGIGSVFQCRPWKRS